MKQDTPSEMNTSRPSHPDIQEVRTGSGEFATTSVSKVTLPPHAVFAPLTFPPCTFVTTPSYATIQVGRDRHISLNSDLLYMNHSCEPSLIVDTIGLKILAGPKGLDKGEELTIFYPATEWHMAQPFDCKCGMPTCRGRISGARDMAREQLSGIQLSPHVDAMIAERDAPNTLQEPVAVVGVSP